MGNNVYTFAHTNYYEGRLKKKAHFLSFMSYLDNRNHFYHRRLETTKFYSSQLRDQLIIAPLEIEQPSGNQNLRI